MSAAWLNLWYVHTTLWTQIIHLEDAPVAKLPMLHVRIGPPRYEPHDIIDVIEDLQNKEIRTAKFCQN